MNLVRQIQRFRDWSSVPTPHGRFNPIRWVLLEGSRLAVASVILAVVYISMLTIGLVWTETLQIVLSETFTIGTILDTFLSGIILLVSIVVSINAVVLSQDIGSVQNQAEQTRGTRQFRSDIGAMTETGESPSDPRAFFSLMTTVITDRAQTLAEDATTESGFTDDIEAYAESVLEGIEYVEDIDTTGPGDFDALWAMLEVDYGAFLERSRTLRSDHREVITESCDEQLESIAESIQVFAIGREHFKTLYYYKEVSVLSRTLLIVSLPTILVVAMSIFASAAGIFPGFEAASQLVGVPPRHIFLSTALTIALLPYVVLTSYMLRLTTVGIRTASAGPFSLND